MTCEDSTTAQSCNNNNNHHAKDQLLHYIYEGFAQRRPRPSWPIVFFFSPSLCLGHWVRSQMTQLWSVRGRDGIVGWHLASGFSPFF